MSEETTKRPAKISRDELYRRVWETPMFKLATEFGISATVLPKSATV